MNEREAQEIIRLVESNWRFDLGPARSLWRAALTPHSADIATKAVAQLAASTKRIDLADVLDVIRLKTPRIRPEGYGNETRSTEIPEWVYVWGWARHHRTPLLDPEIGLPQQHPYGAMPPGTLTIDEYEKLRVEWEAAGAPRDVFRDSIVRQL